MLAKEFKIGELYSTTFTVTNDMTINRSGRQNAEVLSTPSLLNLMEMCTIEASDQYLNDEYTTVGYAVDKMRHLAPTLPGGTVKISATLTNVNNNKLTYSIEATEEGKNIGVQVAVEKHKGKYQVVYLPNNLSCALWLQFFNAISSERVATHAICPWCKTIFQQGRADQQFCSRSHKTQYNRKFPKKGGKK